MRKKPLVIAILAKSVGHILPFYLDSLLAQTEISSDTIFYIRTNDNNDDTSEVLRDFYKKYKWKHKIYLDDSSIDSNLISTGNHDWNANRFKILGKIRQNSCDFALSEGADYFIADCDNICLPHTINAIRSTGFDVVAPLLRTPNLYSNYHSSIDQNGYFKESPEYHYILNQTCKGLIEVPVVHCTYYIANNALDKIVYDDNSGRYEYVIFSDNLRKNEIKQYIDNREIYGRIFWSSNIDEFKDEMLIPEYYKLRNTIKKSI